MMSEKLECLLIVIAIIFIIRMISFFAGSETAFLSLNKIRIRQLLQEKKKGSKLVANLKNHIDELLTVVLIGTNFMNSLASALMTALAIRVLGNSGVGVATILVTFLATIFGQIIPKTIASVHTEKVACKNALVLTVLQKIFFPIVWIFTLGAKGAVKIADLFWKKNNELITEEELKILIDVSAKEGTLEERERYMLNKIFKFSDLSVHDIMKHRSLVQSVELFSSKEQVVSKFNECGLKRIAVYKENLEQIVGVIDYKDVLFLEYDDTQNSSPYAQFIMQTVDFIPETFSALELLSHFKKSHTEFAVALDEQGQTAGVVTMDDILRVVFGRLTDEENASVSPESKIKFVGANEFIVPGDMKIDDLNNIIKLHLESEYFLTVGGWLLEQFGSLPNIGEVFRFNGNLFIVEDQSGRRIQSVKIRLGVDF